MRERPQGPKVSLRRRETSVGSQLPPTCSLRMCSPLFEGGQTPLYKRLPKRGFVNRNRDELQVVNLDRLQYWVDTGRLDTDRMLTMRDLVVLIPPILSELIELHRRVVRLVVPTNVWGAIALTM